jgi:hypothetical protein
MSNERLNIPKQLKVGYQKRTDTYSGKLAYVTYIDKKGKVAKHMSWEHWRSKEMDVNDYDNVPTEGFVLNKRVGGHKSGWNFRQTKCRVFDPRGFEVEISMENLLYILQECTSTKGKGLEGEFVYAWQGPELILLPVCSEDYKASSELIEKTEKITMKDLKIGSAYKGKESDYLVYIGKMEWYLWQDKQEVISGGSYYRRYRNWDELKKVILPTFFDPKDRIFRGYKNMEKLDYLIDTDVITMDDVAGYCENFKETSAYQNQYIKEVAINDSLDKWNEYLETDDNYSWGEYLIMKRPTDENIIVMIGTRNKTYQNKKYADWLYANKISYYTPQEERERVEKEWNDNCKTVYTFKNLGYIQYKMGKLEFVENNDDYGTLIVLTNKDWDYISDGDSRSFSFLTTEGKKIKMRYYGSMSSPTCKVSENVPLPENNF